MVTLSLFYAAMLIMKPGFVKNETVAAVKTHYMIGLYVTERILEAKSLRKIVDLENTKIK
jgi:hypothetical protein